MTKQAKLPSGGMLLTLTAAMAKAQEISLDPNNIALLDAIKTEGAKQIDAKNAADAAKTGKSGLWGNCVKLAEIVAAATQSNEREMVFTIVARDLLEGEGTNTAKMYASTAKDVLVKLHTEQGKSFAEIAEASYGDIRKMLKPDLNPEFTQRLAELSKRLKYVGRKGDKAVALALLSELEKLVEKPYNTLKAAADAKSAAAEAAKTLEANKQQAPSDGATVETVAKQEAVAG